MTTKTPVGSRNGRPADELLARDILPLLADERRRRVLHYLSQRVGTVSLGELAEQLALWDDNPTYDHYERILTGLHHRDLPMLIDGGLVHYDAEREAVNGLAAIDAVRPYLDLALDDDLQ